MLNQMFEMTAIHLYDCMHNCALRNKLLVEALVIMSSVTETKAS
jgi:hypothetical protein